MNNFCYCVADVHQYPFLYSRIFSSVAKFYSVVTIAMFPHLSKVKLFGNMVKIFLAFHRSAMESLSTFSLLLSKHLAWMCKFLSQSHLWMYTRNLYLIKNEIFLFLTFLCCQAATCQSRCLQGTLRAPTWNEQRNNSTAFDEFVFITFRTS